MNRSEVISTLEEYQRATTTSLAVRCTSRIIDCERTLRQYLQIFIRKLVSCECDDPFLTAVFINLYNAFQKNRYCRLSTDLYYGIIKTEVENLLLLDRDLTDVREGINYGLMNVFKAIQTNDWEFLKVLIMYGIIRPKETLPTTMEWTHIQILGNYLYKITLMHKEKQQLERLNDHFRNVLRKLKLKSLDSVDADERRRLSRKYNILKSQAFNDDYAFGFNASDIVVTCLKYYFQAIPNIFVTLREVEDLIEMPERLESMVDMHPDRIDFLMSNSYVLHTRSLKHLSRCAAREHLCKYGLLPAVEQSIFDRVPPYCPG